MSIVSVIHPNAVVVDDVQIGAGGCTRATWRSRLLCAPIHSRGIICILMEAMA